MTLSVVSGVTTLMLANLHVNQSVAYMYMGLIVCKVKNKRKIWKQVKLLNKIYNPSLADTTTKVDTNIHLPILGQATYAKYSK